MMHVVKIQTVTNSENGLSSMNAVLAEKSRADRMEISGIPSPSYEKVRMDGSSSLPNYCKQKGVMCQTVDSSLIPNIYKR